MTESLGAIRLDSLLLPIKRLWLAEGGFHMEVDLPPDYEHPDLSLVPYRVHAPDGTLVYLGCLPDNFGPKPAGAVYRLDIRAWFNDHASARYLAHHRNV